MARVTSKVNCECGFPTHFEYKKPDYFTPTSGTAICKECGSKFQYVVKKQKQHGKVSIKHRVVEPSKILNDLKSIDEVKIDVSNEQKGTP